MDEFCWQRFEFCALTYCTADRNLTFFDTPEFLSLSLHSFGLVAIPIHLLGGYCILFRTPEAMKSVKWSMFNFHFWTCFLDLSLSVLTTPFLVIPIMAGFPLGVLQYTGMSTALQTYFVVAVLGIMAVSIVGVFENRFRIITIRNVWWKRVRTPWFALNYAIACVYFYPVYSMIPVDQAAAKAIILEKIPCLSEEVKAAPLFHLAKRTTPFIVTATLELLLIFIQLTILFQKMKRALLQYGANLTKKTVELQKRFMRALMIQLALPVFIVAVPILYIGLAAGLKVHHQSLNNVSILILSSHGFFSTITMLWVQVPYREVILKWARCGRPPKPKPSAPNSINVIVSTVIG